MTRLNSTSKMSLAAVAALAAFSVSTYSANAAGCCLERSGTDQRWKRTDLNFDQCLKLNQERDPAGDNVLEPVGLVRWQTSC